MKKKNNESQGSPSEEVFDVVIQVLKGIILLTPIAVLAIGTVNA